jgi:hypothetical protein
MLARFCFAYDVCKSISVKERQCAPMKVRPMAKRNRRPDWEQTQHADPSKAAADNRASHDHGKGEWVLKKRKANYPFRPDDMHPDTRPAKLSAAAV